MMRATGKETVMQTGISLYFSEGIEQNERTIERARAAGVTFAFTSLHIPEETGVAYADAARHLLACCQDAGIDLMVDVSPVTLDKLGCTRIEDLLELGITTVRLDFGFNARETVELSRSFRIVFNASTISTEDIRAWQAAGADFTRFAACHNFYPKRYTALSVNEVRRINQRLTNLGFTTMGFVPGDGKLRGPLFEGLPTVEEHRDQKKHVALNMLELSVAGETDVVLVGDPGLTDESWDALSCLSAGYLPLRAEIREPYTYLYGQTHHDRPDSSEYVFRSPESRTTLVPATPFEPDAPAAARPCGTIAISNAAYGRYAGEMEISRVDLPAGARMNIAGAVIEADRAFLPYLVRGMGIKLIRP